MELVIREMLSSDWERVAEIYYEGIQSNIATFQQEVPSYEQWDTSHLKRLRYVCIIEDKIVGWAALSPVSSRCIYAGVTEVSIYIDGKFRGLGIGTQLLTYIIKAAEDSSIWTIQAGIMQENQASIKLHQKCGFRKIGYREKIGKDKEGIWRDIILMEIRSTLEMFN